jgi:hypothetical protein
MVNLIMLLSFLYFGSYDTKEDRLRLLSGQSNKTWYLYSQGADNMCAAIQDDNSYLFYADGTFEFDRGMLTEEAGCINENCCSDMVNIIGRWKLIHDQKRLRVIADREAGNEKNILKLTLFDATIDHLDEGVLKLSQVDGETNVTYTYEFRKR